MIASGSEDRTVRLWDVTTGTTKGTLGGHREDITSVAFSPDGRTLASSSRDYTVRLWDAISGHHKATLTGHTGVVRSVAFSPDGKTIAPAVGTKPSDCGTHTQHSINESS